MGACLALYRNFVTFENVKNGSKAHWHPHETAMLTWHNLFLLLAVWHMDIFRLFLCCFLHNSQSLWLLMRQDWQLKNPDAKLWIVCLLGLWLIPSLASAPALQQAVSLFGAGFRTGLLLDSLLS